MDCNRPDDSGDGLSESTAKRTIQAAIEAAEADADTPRIVTVLPGTYAEGGRVTNYECEQEAYKGTTLSCTNRVHITKGLTLRAKDPTRLTEIVGAWDTSEGAAAASIGIGPKAVRCVLINTSARVVLRDFTLRDGAAQDDNTRTTGGYWPTFAGGVAYGQAAYNNYILADCTIRNCSGRRGAACMGGKLIRCRVSESFGTALASANALNSVIYNQCRSTWSQYVLDGCRLCNCTVFGNEGNPTVYFSSGATICNSIVFGCGTFTGGSSAVNATNSVTGCGWVGKGQKDEASVFGAPDSAYYMFKSPLDGDWRIRGDSEYLTLGDAKYIADFDWAAEFEPYKDLDGNTIPASGAIAPGCTQSTFTPVCGPIRLNDKRIVVDGTRKAYAGAYFYSDDKLAQHRLTLTLAPGEYLHSWNAILTYRRFPLPDDSLWVMPPPDVDTRCVNTPAVTVNALWVDPGKKGDDANDGTAEHPFKSLLAAAQYAKDTWGVAKYAVVFAAAGTYTNDPVKVNGVLTRVTDYGAYIRFRGAGAYDEGKSLILGRLDPEVSAGSPEYGRGENAIRCASFVQAGLSCLQGFELRDGRCRTIGGNASSDQGGGIYNGTLSDCHLVNCGAGRGNAGYNVYMERCRVTCPDAVVGGRVLEGAGYAVSCIFENQIGTELGNTYGDGGKFCQCSFYPNAGSRLVGSGAEIYNSTTSKTTDPTSSWNFKVHGLVGSCGTNYKTKDNGYVCDVKSVDVQFVDYQNGDFRLRSTSPAVGYGSFRTFANPNDDDGFWKTYSPDINGKPILFFDGKPLPGAVQELVQVVEVEASDYADVTPVGTQVVEPGESVTVTLGNAVRPPVGFTVGDEEVAGMTYTYTAPTAGAPTNALVIAPLFGTNWYVNAAMPNDDGDGFTPETAKRTLCGAMACRLLAGDVVHAARGDYNTNAVAHATGVSVRSRVVIKKGITLVADEGPEVTFISGAPCSPEHSDGNAAYPGCGTDAIRCATVFGGGTLKGFTCHNGYARSYNNSASIDCYTGGIIGEATGMTIDCVVTNCFGCRNALLMGGKHYRLRMLDTTSPGSFGDWSSWTLGGFYNCILETSSYPSLVASRPVVNCLFRPHGNGQVYSGVSSVKCLTNCVIIGSLRNLDKDTAGTYAPAISNNIICTGFAGTESTIDKTQFKVMTSAQIKAVYDTTTLEFTGVQDPAFCDAGVNVDSQMDAVDLYGNPRTMNGAIDIGPVEWDWRPTYTQTIAQPGVSVRDAAPMVVREDEKVRIYDGDLVMNWTASSRKATIRRRMTFTVTGTGTLTVFADGEEIGTYTQAAEPQMIDFRNTLETSVVKFSYAKGADDTGYVEIGETIGEPGALLIIR